MSVWGNNAIPRFDSLSSAPTAAAYGVGPAWIGGVQYWSDGASWTKASGPVSAITSGAGGENIASFALATGGVNTIESTLFSCSVFGGTNGGGAVNSGANSIGKSFTSNLELSNPSDTYVAGTAHYSQTLGYDNISNGLLSLNFGAHNLIYTACDHAFIMGARNRIEAGSRNSILGHLSQIYGGTDYSCILGSYTAYINSGSNNNTIVGGTTQAINNATAAYGTIIGGAANSITASGSYNVCLGSATGTISGSGGYGLILGGTANTVSGNMGRAIGGSTNTVSGTNATAIGSNCIVAGQNATAIGESVRADGHGQLSIGARVNSVVGDAQTDIFNLSTTTTDATDQITKSAGSNGLTLVNGAYCGEAYVIARKSDGTSSGFLIPFVVDRVGGAITVRKGGTRATDTTILYDGLAIGSAAAPYITGASGIFTVTVQGKAATTINWSCSVRMARVI